MFEGKTHTTERVPDVFAVIRFHWLAIDDLEFKELANIGQKSPRHKVIAIDRRFLSGVDFIQNFVGSYAHKTDGANVIDKRNLDIFSKEREWNAAQQVFCPSSVRNSFFPAGDNFIAQVLIVN